jgi:hypothetical protein
VGSRKCSDQRTQHILHRSGVLTAFVLSPLSRNVSRLVSPPTGSSPRNRLPSAVTAYCGRYECGSIRVVNRRDGRLPTNSGRA